MLVAFLPLLPFVGSVSQPGARGDHIYLPHNYVELVEISGFWRWTVGKENVVTHGPEENQRVIQSKYQLEL